MREKLIERLEYLRGAIVEVNTEVFNASKDLLVAKSVLQDKEDSPLTGGLIDGKNAEIRAAQIRELTSDERANVYVAESTLDGSRTTLSNLNTDLRINLALVELVKGVA
ncbi:MAG: hypothetical protein WA125_16780 [Desulfosporosinus sp.]